MRQKHKAEQLYENQENYDVFDEIMHDKRKMSDLEKFYTKEMDQGETKHITRHFIQNHQDIKTLDVKIMDLKEDPSNIQLLLSVLSMIYENA